MPKTQRATTLESLGAILSSLFVEESIKQSCEIKLRPSDIVIAPYGKSGTTWTQQILHCLRTRGDMDFDDISRVVPWIETSVALGVDLDADQKADPRGFKSHLSWDEIPKGGRYIVVIRDPKDTLYSLYKFFEGWFMEPSSISLDDFARGFYLDDRDYWKHLASWWPRRNDDDLLLMAFEDMKLDLPGTIKRIADFADISLDAELQAITEEKASLPFMQKHKNKFDDLMMRELSEHEAGVPAGSDSSKVRLGQVGEHKQYLSDELSAEFDAVWQQEITERFGFADYQSLITSLR